MKAFRWTLIVLSVVPLVTGAVDLVFGAAAVQLLGTELPESGLLDPTLNSQLRFFGAIWIGYGAALLWIAKDPVSRAEPFRLLAAFLVLSGFGRLLSMAQFGPPAAPLIVAMFVEVVAVPLLAWWHRVLVRRARQP